MRRVFIETFGCQMNKLGSELALGRTIAMRVDINASVWRGIDRVRHVSEAVFLQSPLKVWKNFNVI